MKWIQDYGFRLYNPSIARFLSVDPLTSEYPWYTPYQFAGNKPIIAIDLDGLEDFIVIGKESTKAVMYGPFPDQKTAQEAAFDNPSGVYYLLPEISVAAKKIDTGHSLFHGAGGYGLVTFYDSYQRGVYKSKIEANSRNAVKKINASEVISNVEEISREASSKRNILRNATQQKLSPGGRVMSNLIDQPRVFEDLVERYKQPNPKDTYREVAKAAGRSNSSLKYIVKGGKILGPASTIIEVGIGINNINKAAPGDKNRVIAEEAAGFAGGVAGGTVAATVATTALGIVAGVVGVTPVGWVVIAVGVVAGGAGGYYGSEAARSKVNSTYGNEKNSSEKNN